MKRWMMLAMDQGAIEGALGDASNKSGSNRRSDGWFKRWITEQLKERWVVQSIDQRAKEGVTDGSNDGSESNRRSDGWCERLITKRLIREL